MMRNKFFFILVLVLSFGLSNISAQTPTPVPISTDNRGVKADAKEPSSTPKIITQIFAGTLNGKAKSLPEPPFPAAARAIRASGTVNVQVTIDESGNVISAMAVSGHPLLRQVSEQAARQAKFPRTLLSGQPVKVTGVIVYNFVNPIDWLFIGKALGDAENEIETIGGLKSIANNLAHSFAGESESIKAVVAKFEKDEENNRHQLTTISEVIRSLQSKLFEQPEDLWNFEFGLAVGRIRASYLDEAVLRANLPKLRELGDSAVGSIEKEDLAALHELGKLADKTNFSRKDKAKIQEWIDSVRW